MSDNLFSGFQTLTKLSACSPLSEAYAADARQLIREQLDLQHLIISALRCYVEDDPQLIALFKQGVHDIELLGLLRSNQMILQENGVRPVLSGQEAGQLRTVIPFLPVLNPAAFQMCFGGDESA